MKKMYSPLVYRQVEQNESYTRPRIPHSFVKLEELSRPFNVYSPHASDRTEYWEDIEGSMTYDQMKLMILGFDGIKREEIEQVYKNYLQEIVADVEFTSFGGIIKMYQADANSISNLSAMLLSYAYPNNVPTDFYWVSSDNTKVPFTYADLQDLAKTIGDQGWDAFKNLQNLKAIILAK